MKPDLAHAVAAVLYAHDEVSVRPIMSRALGALREAVGPECATCDGWGHVGSGGAHPEDPNPSNMTECPGCDGTGFPSLREDTSELDDLAMLVRRLAARLPKDDAVRVAALDYTARHGLSGLPVREEEA